MTIIKLFVGFCYSQEYFVLEKNTFTLRSRKHRVTIVFVSFILVFLEHFFYHLCENNQHLCHTGDRMTGNFFAL